MKLHEFLESIKLLKLSINKKNVCEGNLSEKELYDSMISMKNNKSPGNDGLTKEFYETFWNDIKDVFIKSMKRAMDIKELSISQRQAVIKLIEKKDRDKRLLKNWRPISLLNVDLRVVSKAFAARLKTVLSSLFSTQHTAYVAKRFFVKSGRLISDIQYTLVKWDT